jgi:hypothetical protein
MTPPAPQFSLTISLNVLEHLGISLYSNVPAVLSEIVANAWDADANDVHVNWHRNDEKIVIQDSGIGMLPNDINKRFLTVGYRRRDEQPGNTPKGRKPMGRKGIGKLSLFSIANCVEIETVKNGIKSAFRMKLEDIRQKIEQAGGEGVYNPEPLSTDNIDFKNGTRITLSELRKRQTAHTTSALKKRLARRFSVIGASEEFRVLVDNQEVTASDRDYFDKLQYLWTYGQQNEVVQYSINAQHFDRTEASNNAGVSISGWLGTVREVKHLKDEEGENLNRVAIFVRGKMAQEDILSNFSERGVYVSYLIGELRVDSLDTYDGPGSSKDDDAATSSRQQLVEDDERFVAIKAFLATELKHIQSEWKRLKAEEGAQRALQIPAVKDWMDGLPKSSRTKAKKWVGKINQIRIDDLNEQKQLIKHSILAFEFYRAKENLDALERITDENFETAISIFEDLDNLEATLYGQIVQQRIQVIKVLEEKVDINALEKAIQEYLFDHLWLLDPAWERADGSELMERPVTQMIEEETASLSQEERDGRLDIGYRKSAGQHIIIELKRPERSVTTAQLIVQTDKYLSGMDKLLRQQGRGSEQVSIVILLGKEPSDWTTDAMRHRWQESLKIHQCRVVFYEQLLIDARQTYQDYMENRDIVDTLSEIIRAIDNYASEETTER